MHHTSTAIDYTRWVLRGISYLQLRPGSASLELPDLPARIGYTVQNGFALVPGPPLAPYGQWPAAAQGFEAHARALGLHPAYCGIGDLGRTCLAAQGYRTLKLGDEALVPLQGMALAGGAWAEVRAALNRAHRYGIRFRWLEPAGRQARRQELCAVANAWQRRKPLPELRFGLGGVEAIFDPQCRLAIAEDSDGGVVALAGWTPMPMRSGWMLDVMRYRPDVMAGLMDALLGASLLGLSAEGAAVASLGGVPGSNVTGVADGWLRLLLDWAARIIHWPYNAAGLLHFKAKFNPQWEPLYLAVPPSAHMPAALAAVVRAVLPAAPWEAALARRA